MLFLVMAWAFGICSILGQPWTCNLFELPSLVPSALCEGKQHAFHSFTQCIPVDQHHVRKHATWLSNPQKRRRMQHTGSAITGWNWLRRMRKHALVAKSVGSFILARVASLQGITKSGNIFMPARCHSTRCQRTTRKA